MLDWSAYGGMMWLMKKPLLIIVIGACLCLIGGILADCHVQATSIVALVLGVIGVSFGPFLADLS